MGRGGGLCVPAYTPRWTLCGRVLEVADQKSQSIQFQKPTLGSDLLENIPSGAEAEVISVKLESSDTLGWFLYLVLSLFISLLWFSKVYLLLTHPVSSQHVLCHRTRGTTQQGSDSCPTASSHCTGSGGTEEESATVGSNVLQSISEHVLLQFCPILQK